MRPLTLAGVAGTLLVAGAGTALAIPAARAGDPAQVTAAGMSFSPATVTIPVGGSVHWTGGGGTHNVDFDDGSYRNGDPSSHLDATRTFATAGTFTYVCDVHKSEGMVATVVVQGGSTTTPPSSSSTASTTAPPASTTTTHPGTTTTPPATTSPASTGDGGTTTTPSGAPPPPSAPTATASGGELSVKRGAKAGTLTGGLKLTTAGAKVTVRVSFHGKPVGRAKLTRSGTAVHFTVALGRAARARVGSGKLTLRVTVTGAGGARQTLIERAKVA